MTVKIYSERDLMALDKAGSHYCRHISAMTSEGLHSKSDIAAELGWRDMQIAELQRKVEALAAENAQMRTAIEFATAPDMWIEQHDGMLDYRYSEWYVDVLNAAIETPATDAALAKVRNEARAEGVGMAMAELRSLAERSVVEAPIAAGHHQSAATFLSLLSQQLRKEAGQ